LAAFLVLATSLWATALGIERHFGSVVANVLYMMVRLIVVIGLGYILSAAHKRSTFSSLSLISFLVFLDQVPMKTLLYLYEQKSDPAAAAQLSVPALLIGFTTAYGLSIPIVMIFAYAGRLLDQSSK
jgi:hypothetical protein